jgi:hypothetical protein
MPNAQGVGRPWKYRQAPLEIWVRIRAIRSQEKAWRRIAKASGKSLSEWIREVLNAARPSGGSGEGRL